MQPDDYSSDGDYQVKPIKTMKKRTIPSLCHLRMTMVDKIIFFLSHKDLQSNDLIDKIIVFEKLKTLEQKTSRSKSIHCTLTELKLKGIVTKTLIDGKTAIYSLNLEAFN